MSISKFAVQEVIAEVLNPLLHIEHTSSEGYA